MQKAIIKLFYLLFFITPFIFLPYTSEIFEFNKIIFVYTVTILITAHWGYEMIIAKKFIFKRTALDIPLLLFLLSQTLATFFSIDLHTSIFGYYSRFNGGLLSTICYVLLYWAFVAHATKQVVTKSISLLLLGSGVLSIYGILEHFGMSPSCLIINGKLSTDCWVQDVQNRVFATLGQPNWLAAYITSLMPLAWHRVENTKNKTQLGYIILSSALFLVLLYTKSRSGLLAFGVVFVFYWIYKIIQKNISKTLSYLTIIFAIIFGLTTQVNSIEQSGQNTLGPALETGGTESGVIRQIVWKGAWDLFLRYPILGTGVETFAYSYYETRPVEHNLTSEWDFIYNKAHNEFLNILATTGAVGFLTYLILIVTIYWVIYKSNSEIKLPLALGFSSLLITNFFGFSVVNTSILFYIFPAFVLSGYKVKDKAYKKKHSGYHAVFVFLFFAVSYLLYLIVRYWFADVLYKQGNEEHSATKLYHATQLSPYQAVFYSSLAQVYADSAFQFNQMNDSQAAFRAVRDSHEISTISIQLSPRNVNLHKMESNLFIDLAQIDSTYYEKALETAFEIIRLAPTDPSGYHTVGLIFANLDDLEQSSYYLKEAIKLKPDYKNARMALAIVSIEQKNYEEAKKHLRYILEKIAKDDEQARKQLDALEKEP